MTAYINSVFQTPIVIWLLKFAKDLPSDCHHKIFKVPEGPESTCRL